MSKLPDDLLMSVLARLPAQTLMKFRRVSKSWKALIDSNYFMRLHLNHHHHHRPGSSSSSSNIIFEVHYKDGDRSAHYFATDFHSDSPEKMATNMVQLHLPFQTYPDDVRPLYSKACCNGLLCLADSGRNIVFLWNPCTNKHWRLPYSPVVPGSRIDGLRFIAFGFGYDDTNDDYKVVRVVTLYPNFGSERAMKQQVMIYSLKSNSWKSLPPFPNEGIVHGDSAGPGACLGILHWRIMFRRGASPDEAVAILALNLRTEKYHLLPRPPGFVDSTVISVDHLRVLDGCLCWISQFVDGCDKVDIWMMRDYGINGSWTKIMSIPRGDLPMPIVYSQRVNSGVFFLHDRRTLMCYDGTTRESVEAEAKFHSSISVIMDGYHFVGSLVDPSGGHCGGGGGGGRKRGIKRRGKEFATPDLTTK